MFRDIKRIPNSDFLSFYNSIILIGRLFSSVDQGKLGVIASEEEESPVLVEEAFNSKYVAVFDPLDGSSNIDAAISTGTIFGIFEEQEVASTNFDLNNCYCSYNDVLKFGMKVRFS